MEIITLVLNFILAACCYSYRFPSNSIDLSKPASEIRENIEYRLHQNDVLKPRETLADFFTRKSVRDAFRVAEVKFNLSFEQWLNLENLLDIN